MKKVTILYKDGVVEGIKMQDPYITQEGAILVIANGESKRDVRVIVPVSEIRQIEVKEINEE